MFYRQAITKLNEWATRNDRKPLILRGAMQVDKTTVVELFSKNFEQYIYLNLEKINEQKLFEKYNSTAELISSIFFYKNKTQKKGRTLLFIDEIQNSPKAVSQLRYFYEDPKDLYVIAAGSLLETLIDKTISFPVGRVEYLLIRPCSFLEFLTATGEEQSVNLINTIPFPDYGHDKLLTFFRKYALIGGMPEVIKKYSETKDIRTLTSTG